MVLDSERIGRTVACGVGASVAVGALVGRSVAEASRVAVGKVVGTVVAR